ncbi:alpha/beta hydrolase [Sporolituus thermophilus]|uniref:Carboxylesterase n=1 Tax=Sporolituus thermophilus DSM 23256 TaxID=1123285 RepID=A0A1G7N1G8_9FIRM|nr:alpha/beta fold hydrolase [Sporolituus thermophilus]SDF67802.1 carboxylesterase [Sporolituus thermophilus DSM 23256]
MAIIRGAEPFLLPGGDYGVLLVHGFTGSPAEMRLAGQYLHDRGYTVLAPRLCGHGTNEREMRLTVWPHWYGAVEDGYHLLRGLCRKVAAVGLSMGGLMVLKLAAEYPVDKVVSLSAPIYIADRRLHLLPAYRLFRRYIPKKRKRYDVDPIYTVGYDRTPLDCVTSLLALIKHVDKLLPVITAPALVIQSQAEHTVRPESARHIFDRLGSADKQLIWLRRSGHVVTLDVERDEVFAQIDVFLRRE